MATRKNQNQGEPDWTVLGDAIIGVETSGVALSLSNKLALIRTLYERLRAMTPGASEEMVITKAIQDVLTESRAA